jgi:diguanylate cyclase (GGDEF)-like protein
MLKNKVPWNDFRSRPKILLVDDQPANIRILNEIFRDDCDVFMATSGQQAIDACLSEAPDLILMDIVMPEMDGLEALRRLKAIDLTAQIPVIFVTGQQDDENEEIALAAGAVDFITKPIRPAIVRARARTHLALKYKSDLLRDIAMVDGLTGAPNRRRFDETLVTEWNRCARDKLTLSLAMIDVDYFKRFNDTYGHQAGDACLVKVAGALRSCLNRPKDLLARYGGEEFVCLLPQTPMEGSDLVASQMLDAVRLLGIPHVASDAADVVTVSIGISTIQPNGDHVLSELVGRADRALYAAKNAGRNRMVRADIAS